MHNVYGENLEFEVLGFTNSLKGHLEKFWRLFFGLKTPSNIDIRHLSGQDLIYRTKSATKRKLNFVSWKQLASIARLKSLKLANCCLKFQTECSPIPPCMASLGWDNTSHWRRASFVFLLDSLSSPNRSGWWTK